MSNEYLNKAIVSSELAEAVSPSNSLDQLGLDLGNGVGREVGGEFRMGNTCTPMAVSCQCMAKTTTML